MPRFTPTPFQCHPLLLNQHAHTIYASLAPRQVRAPEAWAALAEERLFEMPDGDRLLGIHHPHPEDPDRERPIVVLLHGLEGSADSHYVRGISAKAAAVGWHSLRLNFRNCGNTEHLAQALYNGALLDDVAAVLDQLAASGYRRVVIAGISLGGNLLLKLLARYGERPPAWLVGATAICPAIDMPRTSAAFGEGFNQVYDRYFLVQLKEKVRRKIRLSPNGERFEPLAARLDRIGSLREFDELVTAPMCGFADAAAYYRTASSGDQLGEIRVPTLLIAAQDDPFIPFAVFRQRMPMIEANPFLTPCFPRFGGHVGFVEWQLFPPGEPWMDEYWAENQAIAFTRWLTRETPVPAA